jgi:hypothetical protein
VLGAHLQEQKQSTALNIAVGSLQQPRSSCLCVYQVYQFNTLLPGNPNMSGRQQGCSMAMKTGAATVTPALHNARACAMSRHLPCPGCRWYDSCMPSDLHGTPDLIYTPPLTASTPPGHSATSPDIITWTPSRVA